MTLRTGWLVTIALLVAVAFGFQGSRGLYETTEGRYAESAREMMVSGRYMEPTLAGRPHWTKPPPVYWSIAAGLSLLGPNSWGARIPNAVAFVATALLVGAIGASLWDRRTGLLATLVYSSSIFPAVGANVVSADTLLTLVEVAAVLAYVRGWRATGTVRRRRWVRVTWFLFGIAFFVKGPPALLPLLALVVFAHVARDRAAPGDRPPRLGDPLGIVIFLVTGAWWYLLSVMRTPGLLGYFLHDEVVGRVLSDEHHRNPEWYKPFLVYLPPLLLGAGAWLAYAVPAVRRGRLLHPSTWTRRIRNGGPAAFLALWLLVPLVVFSLARSRLPLYVLPLYAPIALGIARVVALRTAPRTGGLARRPFGIAAASVAVLLALKAASAHVPSRSDMAALSGAVRQVAGPGARVWLFDSKKLYGLDFYLGGGVRRASIAGTEPWSDGDLRAALQDVEARHTTRTLLLASGAWSDTVRATLAREPVTWRRVAADGRDLYLVGPMMAARPARE